MSIFLWVMAVGLISFAVGALVMYTYIKTQDKSKQGQKQLLTEKEAYDQQMTTAAKNARSLAEILAVFASAEVGSEAEEIAYTKCRCEEIQCQSLLAVVQAKTPRDLHKAKKAAELCNNRTALSLVAPALEEIARNALLCAGGSTEKIITILGYAPQDRETYNVAFHRLQQLMGSPKT